MTQELLFSKYAEQYPLTVPQEAMENELQLLILEEKQSMQYEMLTGSAMNLSPQEELNEKLEAMQVEALRRAKETLVLREIMAAHPFPVSQEELEAEAAAIAQRQNTTVAELKRFSAKTSPCCKATCRNAKPSHGPVNRWRSKIKQNHRFSENNFQKAFYHE